MKTICIKILAGRLKLQEGKPFQLPKFHEIIYEQNDLNDGFILLKVAEKSNM